MSFFLFFFFPILQIFLSYVFYSLHLESSDIFRNAQKKQQILTYFFHHLWHPLHFVTRSSQLLWTKLFSSYVILGIQKLNHCFIFVKSFSYQRSSRCNVNEYFLTILTYFTHSFEFLSQLQLSYECTHDCKTSVLFLYFPSSVMHLFWEKFTRPCHSSTESFGPKSSSGLTEYDKFTRFFESNFGSMSKSR